MSKYLILLTMIVVGCGGSAGENPGGSGGDGGTGGVAGIGGSGGTVNTGGTGGVGGVGGEAGNGGTAGVGGVGGAVEPGCVPVVTVGGNTPLCGDCIDNDNDGLFDSEDPYCLGPYDNKESDENLGTGVGGETGENCKADCYFDWGNGSGNDTCTWNHGCDVLAYLPLDPEDPEGRHSGPMANCSYTTSQYENFCRPLEDYSQTDLCLDVCEPLTPNGCDCFGCCDVAGVEGHVFLGTEDGDLGGNCTLDTPWFCASCTPQLSCYNELGECELGIGMTLEDLYKAQPHCEEEDRCPDEGVQPCGEEGDDVCPDNSYCITGCCVEIIVQ